MILVFFENAGIATQAAGVRSDGGKVRARRDLGEPALRNPHDQVWYYGRISSVVFVNIQVLLIDPPPLPPPTSTLYETHKKVCPVLGGCVRMYRAADRHAFGSRLFYAPCC